MEEKIFNLQIVSKLEEVANAVFSVCKDIEPGTTIKADKNGAIEFGRLTRHYYYFEEESAQKLNYFLQDVSGVSVDPEACEISITVGAFSCSFSPSDSLRILCKFYTLTKTPSKKRLIFVMDGQPETETETQAKTKTEPEAAAQKKTEKEEAKAKATAEAEAVTPEAQEEATESEETREASKHTAEAAEETAAAAEETETELKAEEATAAAAPAFPVVLCLPYRPEAPRLTSGQLLNIANSGEAFAPSLSVCPSAAAPAVDPYETEETTAAAVVMESQEETPTEAEATSRRRFIIGRAAAVAVFLLAVISCGMFKASKPSGLPSGVPSVVTVDSLQTCRTTTNDAKRVELTDDDSQDSSSQTATTGTRSGSLSAVPEPSRASHKEADRVKLQPAEDSPKSEVINISDIEPDTINADSVIIIDDSEITEPEVTPEEEQSTTPAEFQEEDPEEDSSNALQIVAALPLLIIPCGRKKYRFKPKEVENMKDIILVHLVNDETAWRLRSVLSMFSNCLSNKAKRAKYDRELALYKHLTNKDRPNWL